MNHDEPHELAMNCMNHDELDELSETAMGRVKEILVGDWRYRGFEPDTPNGYLDTTGLARVRAPKVAQAIGPALCKTPLWALKQAVRARQAARVQLWAA